MSFKERFINHVKNNRGKYGAGAGLAAGAGAIKLGSTGVAGTQVQDAIQNVGGDIVRGLDASADYDNTKANVDALSTVYKKTDNIIYNPSEENDKLLMVDRIIQKENIPYLIKKGASNITSSLTGVNDDPGKINYIIRNPGSEANYHVDSILNKARALKDSIAENL